MRILSTGNYLGTKTELFEHNKLIFSKSTYCNGESKDWHCHENAFFAYFLKGSNYEFRRSKEIRCAPGTLLFYQAMEPHCNKSYTTGCKIFHIEIDHNWFYENELEAKKIKADVIEQATAKNTFTHILHEFYIRDELSGDSIENLLLYLWNSLSRNTQAKNYTPVWVRRFNDIKNDCDGKLTLTSAAKQLNMHPVTLSKEFPQYYHCSFGEYIRQFRVEKSLALLSKKNMPVSEVAFACGFSDASNFIRSFKKVKGITPNDFRNLL